MQRDNNGTVYVLGSDPAEQERLVVQHHLWRPRAEAAWRRAGLAAGDSVLDLGCGPGLAAADLAVIVAPAGRVVMVSLESSDA